MNNSKHQVTLLKNIARLRASYSLGMQTASKARLPLVVIEAAVADLTKAKELIAFARNTRIERGTN